MRPQSRLVTAGLHCRRVTCTEYDGDHGAIGTSASIRRTTRWSSDRTVWFADPTYGISATYEGGKGGKRSRKPHVYYFDARDGSLCVVADDFRRPNGIAFSCDGKLLYIADCGF